MILRLGRFTLAWGKFLSEKAHVVYIEEVIKVRKPVIVEVPYEVRVNVVKRVEVPVEVPQFIMTFIDHQVVIHRQHVIEKPFTIEVPKPVVKEVEKEVVLEHLTITEKEIEVPAYKIVYGEPVEVKAPLDQAITYDVKCLCGNVYKSNMTKCTKCGRNTIETIKELSL